MRHVTGHARALSAAARRARLLVAVLASFTLAGFGAVPAAASLATSHAFAGWSIAYSGSPDVTFSADDATVHGGTAALRVVNQTPKAANTYAQMYQSFPVQPGVTYHFSAWVKASGASTAAAVYIPLNPSWSVRQIVPGGTYDWRQLTWDYTIPAGQTSFTYRILSQDVGTTWLDDLSMTADGSSTNLLQNAGFETSTAPAADLGISNVDLVFDEGDVTIGLTSTRTPIAWTVRTLAGQEVRSGSTPLTGGAGALSLDDLGRGYYALHLATPGDSPTVRDTSFVVGDPAPAAASPDTHPFGVGTHIGQTNADQLGAVVDGLGVTNVRFDVSWSNVETTKGQYTFAPVYDTQVAELVARGVRPLIILDYRNRFYDDNKTPSTPEGIAAFAAYAGAVAAHYGSAADYEVYNEYNHTFNDGACGRTADCYVQLLGPAAAAIKAAAPDARVVGPALAEIDMAWFERLFELGGLDVLDVLSVHTYDWPAAPEGQTEAEIAPILALMRTYHDGGTIPIWWTEQGWPTPVGGNSEQQQADYTTRAFVLLNAAGVEKSFVYDLIATANPTDALSNYGIMRDVQSGLSTLAPKPAYGAYSVLNRSLAGATYASRDELGPEVYSFRYQRAEGGDTRVMWSTAPATVEVTSSGPFQVVDTYGASYTADGSAQPVELTLSGSPVYVTGSTVTGVAGTDAPRFDVALPAQVGQGTPVDAGVAVQDGSVGTVTFADETGAQVDVAVAAGGDGTGTLELAPFTRLGAAVTTVTASQGGRLVALVKVGTEVVESPSVALVPTVDEETGRAFVRIDNRVGQQAVDVGALDWSVGTQSGRLEPKSQVGAGGQHDIELPIDPPDLWRPLPYATTVTLGDGDTRSANGTTAFAPLYSEGAGDGSGIDLSTDTRFVSLGGQLGGAGDLGGTVRLSYSGAGLRLDAEVSDDAHVPGDSAASLWRGDSLQFALSPGLPGSSGSRVELGAALLASGPVVYGFSTPSGPVDSASVHAHRDDATGVTTYDVLVPWSVLGVDPADGRFAFSLVVNDNDGGGRDGYLEWGSGIGASKDPSAFLPVTVVPPSDGAQAAPARGALHTDNGWDTGLMDGTYNVVFDLWWGENGTSYRLYEDGALVAVRSLSPRSPSAQTVSVPITGQANGTYSYTAELVNSRGVTSTDALTVEVTDANPGKPVLSADNWNGDGTYTVTADLWWGTNATGYRFLQDGAEVASGPLVAASPGSQQAQLVVQGQSSGTYTYTVEFSNEVGTTTSEPFQVTVRP